MTSDDQDICVNKVELLNVVKVLEKMTKKEGIPDASALVSSLVKKDR